LDGQCVVDTDGPVANLLLTGVISLRFWTFFRFENCSCQ